MKLASTWHTQILWVQNTPTEIFQFTGCANMQTLKNSYLCPLKNFLIAEILLHTAVCNKSSTNITNKLLEHYLGSVKIKDHQEAVPLHIGLVFGSVHASGDSLVHLLFGFYPEAKKMYWSRGYIPLHLTISHHVSFYLVESLVKCRLKSAWTTDYNDRLPFHVTVQSHRVSFGTIYWRNKWKVRKRQDTISNGE